MATPFDVDVDLVAVVRHRPALSEVGAGAQCGDCGRDIFAALQWDAERELFVCDCGAAYGLREGGYLAERPREEGDQ